MPFFKVQFKFSQQRQGWREGFILQMADGASLKTQILDLAKLRAKCLASNVGFDSYQYSEINWRGDGFENTTPQTYAKTALPGEVVNRAYLIRVYESTRYWRNMWLHGLPDDWVVYDAATQNLILATGQLTVQAYINALIAAPSYFQGAVKLGDVANIELLDSFIAVAGDSESTQITLANPLDGLVQNGILALTNGRKTATGFNGKWRIIATDGVATCTLNIPFRKVKNAAPEDYVKVEGYIYATDFYKMTNVSYTDIRTHKCGRPPFAARGRRSNRK